MFPIRDHNPSTVTPYVTLTLIGVNIVVFLLGLVFFQSEQALNRLYFDYAMIPARISYGEGFTGLFTSLFLHGGIMHLVGNMLFLWVFGDNLEDELGHVPFLLFYLACGIGASLMQWASAPLSPVPMVGASGAIAGVMGAYLLLFPKAKVDILVILIVFYRILPIPAWIMLAVWFVLQLFYGFRIDPAGGGVAYWAHAGGFIIGFLGILPLWLRRGGPRFWTRTHGHPPHPETQYRRSNVPIVRR